MYKSIVLACFLGVLLIQVYAKRNERVECLQRLTRVELHNWKDRMAKTRTCKDVMHTVEELYDYLEDCSIDGSAIDSLSSIIDDVCEPGSKVYKDFVSGTECWPSSYSLHIVKCAFDYLSKLMGESINLIDGVDEKFTDSLLNLTDGKSCPSFKPLFHCFKNSTDTLCEGKSKKLITRLVDGMYDLMTGICNSFSEGA